MIETIFGNIANLLTYDPKNPILFNTGFFLWWFLLILSIFYLLRNKQTAKVLFLAVTSIFFYYKSSGVFFLLLLFTTFLDYNLARFITKTDNKRNKLLLLLTSLIVNFGLLAYFKYTNFFIDTYNNIFNGKVEFMDIFLPIGISFYTFQTLSYTVDVYRGKLQSLNSYLDFVFYVSFFPQLVAGPIVRATDFIPQIHKPTFVTKEDIGKAVFLIVAGLFKKAVISDYISVNYVDRIFDNPMLYSGFENLMGVYGYALQIYCDFSGYSDMAIGLALLMGYKLMINFDSPYQSSSITEFWRRWHISLSSWLKDYLYISLGGNKKGKIRQYINLMITMLLGGLWHGASWKFVLWGGLHGGALAVDKFIKEKFPNNNSKVFKILGILFTFHFVCLCWILFRASSFQSAMDVMHQIAFAFDFSLIDDFYVAYFPILFLFFVGYVLHFIPKKIELDAQKLVTLLPLWAKAALILLVIWLIIQVKSSEIQAFIYFQF